MAVVEFIYHKSFSSCSAVARRLAGCVWCPC